MSARALGKMRQTSLGDVCAVPLASRSVKGPGRGDDGVPTEKHEGDVTSARASD